MTTHLNLKMFRNSLVVKQNRAVDFMNALERRDGSVSKENLIAYTVCTAEASIFGEIIKALDESREYDTTC